MMGLALLSISTLPNSFPPITVNLSTTRLADLTAHVILKEHKSLGLLVPARDDKVRERPLAAGHSLQPAKKLH